MLCIQKTKHKLCVWGSYAYEYHMRAYEACACLYCMYVCVANIWTRLIFHERPKPKMKHWWTIQLNSAWNDIAKSKHLYAYVMTIACVALFSFFFLTRQASRCKMKFFGAIWHSIYTHIAHLRVSMSMHMSTCVYACVWPIRVIIRFGYREIKHMLTVTPTMDTFDNNLISAPWH